MKIILLIYLILLCSMALTAEKSGCIDGKIKYLENKKEIVVHERYCYDSLLHSISSVKKCADQKECISNLPGPFPIKKSAATNLCEKLNGIPQFIQFWDGESWIKTSRCIFNDGSYADTASLNLKVKPVR